MMPSRGSAEKRQSKPMEQQDGTTAAQIVVNVRGGSQTKRACREGVLFGNSCERRVFFPSSQNATRAEVAVVDEDEDEDTDGRRSKPHRDGRRWAQQQHRKETPFNADKLATLAPLRLAVIDPLSALGLMPRSPYKILRRSAVPVPAVAADEDGAPEKRRSKPLDRLPSAEAQHRHPIDYNTPMVLPPRGNGSLRWLTPRGRNSFPLKDFDLRDATFEDIYSPQRSQRAGSSTVARESAIYHRRGNCRDDNLAIASGYEESGSVATLLRRIRADERATIREATRLRREADPGALIRRFLRSSGLPLDHIFATAARVYSRARLQPAFSTWHSYAIAETCRYNRRTDAAETIQGRVRVHLAHRTIARCREARGVVLVRACCAVQRAFRSYHARRVARARFSGRRQHAERRKRECELERAEADRRRDDASTVIQVAWRAAVGRQEGAARGRGKLKGVLCDLSGGQGRTHRVQNCSVSGGCLEHVALARACEVVLKVPGRSRHHTLEVFHLLSRCRLLLAARQKLSAEMRTTWAREAEAHAAAKTELERARKGDILHQAQLRSQQLEADARETQERERDLLAQSALARMGLSRKNYITTKSAAEEDRTRKSEMYLMWREEKRQNEIASERQAAQERREAQELVIMRREELLSKKAWALECARVQWAMDLREHEERISRLSWPFPASTGDGSANNAVMPLLAGSTDIGVVATDLAPSAGNQDKPEAVILDRANCIIDGRNVATTAVIRPSKASMLTFTQAAAVRETVRDLDDARRSVAHWEARCRLDAAGAVKVRGEQFRLRCKTKGERRQKAAEVEAAKRMAESSIVRLSAAKENARRATVARATALADALGVEPPQSLFKHVVVDEDHEIFAMRDAAAGRGTCPVGPFVITQDGATGAVDGRYLGAVCDTGRSPPARSKNLPPPRKTATREKTLEGDTWGAGRSSPTSKQTTRVRHHQTSPGVTAMLTSGGVSSCSTRMSPCTSRGWSREWCGSVDTWCRNASARFRARVAVNIAASARRLHWLAGPVGCYCCSTLTPDLGCIRAGRLAVGHSRRRNSPDVVGEKNWAAIVKFGDVADILELVGCTFELEISVRDHFAMTAENECGLDASTCENVYRHGVCEGPGPTFYVSGSETPALPTEDQQTPGRSVLPEILNRVSEDPYNSALVPTGESEPGAPHGNRYRFPAPEKSTLASVTEESEKDWESSDGEEGIDGPTMAALQHQRLNIARKTSNTSTAERCDANTEGGHEKGKGGRGEAAEEPRGGRTACITLPPSVVGEVLGITPLSYFVLQAARQVHSGPAPIWCNSGLGDGRARAVSIGCAAKRAQDVARYNETGSSCTSDVANSADEKRTGRVLGPDASTGPGRFSPSASVGPASSLPSGTRATVSCPPLSAREKQGLACAVKCHVLSHLRLSPSLSGPETSTTDGVGRQPVLRLRLKLEGPNTARAWSPPNDIRATGNGTGLGIASPPPGDVEDTVEIGNEAAAGEAMKWARARRFLQAPLQRWVGRVRGRRCLLSCPVFSSLESGLDAGLPEYAAETSAMCRDSRNGNATAHRVRATFVGCSDACVSDLNGSARLVQERQHMRRFAVFLMSPPAVTLDAIRSSPPVGRSISLSLAEITSVSNLPLCDNCGRLALQRVRDLTDLLYLQPHLRSATTRGLDGVGDLPVNLQCNYRWYASGVDRGESLINPQTPRLARGRVSGGRVGVWRRRSGSSLCSPCWRALRTPEVPAGRVTVARDLTTIEIAI